MKIGEHSIKHLAKAVCGDCSYMPYLKGYELVILFNKYGFSDEYGAGFPSRWQYTEDKIREINNSDKLRTLIEEVVDPRRFHDLEIEVDHAVKEINDFLKYDDFELKKSGEFYKVYDKKGVIVNPETTKLIDHNFIHEQINKCNKKILEEDFSGAITNARTLVEAILIEIIEKSEKHEIKNDGDIDNQWKKVRKILRLEITKSDLPDTIIQILSGLESTLKGLAGLSNNSADRHANKFNTKKHHAKLAVNVAMTFADFLLDSYNYQRNK